MVIYNGEFFCECKVNGLVKDVFGVGDVEVLMGCVGIGYVCYLMVGFLSVFEVQFFFVNVFYGIYLVYNGNIINMVE